MRNALIYLFLLVFSLQLSAQEGADSAAFLPGRLIPVEGAFVQPLQERDSVLIADQLFYGFELKQVEDGTLIAFPEVPEEQDDRLMFLSDWTMDTVKVTKGKKGQPDKLDLKGGIVITSFEEGVYELPQIILGRLSKDGVVDTLIFDPVKVEVKTMPVDTTTFQPHDIKGQMNYPVTFKEILPWLIIGIAAVLLVVLIVWLVKKYRQKSDPAFARKDPAHIIALRKLDQYRGNKMWVPEKQKLFYSGVTDTLREYISSRYDISAMEMTTAEIFKDMAATDAPEALVAEVKELFERADFVKFAKYVASDEENAAALPVAVRFVSETYQAEIENEGGE